MAKESIRTVVARLKKLLLLFSTTGVGQPWHDLALALLIANSPLPVKDDVTGLTFGGQNKENPLPNFSIKSLSGFPNLKRLRIQNVSNLIDPELFGKQETLQQLEIETENFKKFVAPPNLKQLVLLEPDARQTKPVDLSRVAAIQSLTHFTLKLNNHYAQTGTDSKGAQAFEDATELTHLELNHNNIGNKGIEALSKLTNLTHLELTHNNIDAGAVHALTTLTNLTHLNLRYNKIGDEDMLTFLRIYTTAENKLKYLNLEFNCHPDFEISEINGMTDASTIFAAYRRRYPGGTAL